MVKKLKIIYEDKKIIVVSKDSGLLSIGTSKERNKTLYNEVKEYVKKQNPKNKIFIVHRLDKDTSGVILFAKSEEEKYKWQNSWNDVKRKYYAIVKGILKEKEGIIKNYLFEDKNHIVHSTHDKTKGKLSITEYRVLKEKNNISLLDINLKTGRKNQIRVHMRDNNTPILGDVKYSNDKNEKRMYLHAYRLKLINPKTKKEIIFETNIPKEFNKKI